MDDMEFLHDWVERGSEDSFRTLVDRHLNMVYCAARRLVPSSHQAEEVTQTVLVILAKKASGLSMHSVLAGWLYRTTRYTAAQMIRMDHLYSPKCLTCPSDAGKTAVTKWSRLKAANVSYALVSPNLKDTRSNVVIAKCPIHGHVVLSSGQAFQGEYIRQTGMKIKEDNTLE